MAIWSQERPLCRLERWYLAAVTTAVATYRNLFATDSFIVPMTGEPFVEPMTSLFSCAWIKQLS